MGEQDVSNVQDQRALQAFTKALLEDVHALELLLEGDLIESGVSRIGAEQEMCLLKNDYRPSSNSLDIIKDSSELISGFSPAGATKTKKIVSFIGIKA